MLSSSQKKFVNSLKQKKFRSQHQSFIVEGVKMIDELLQSDYEVVEIFATNPWKEKNSTIDCIEVSEKELKSISSLQTPNEVIAVVKQKDIQLADVSCHLSIALDAIQDPGNLGAIIRTADWFGINNIICSENTVDVYNSKVMQATMGSFFRVNIVYSNLDKFFSSNEGLIVYGAFLKGENIYEKQIGSKGSVLLMGNESKGISGELIPFITDNITIPKFGGAESLNVSTATAIFCYECMRG